MSDYNTGNSVPSIDPRDLDDNATNFDRLLLLSVPSVPDRLGVPRKTWYQMEQDAAALVSPNVSALAALTLSSNKGLYATGAGALATFDLSSLGRTLGGIANAAAGRTAISAAALGANGDITSLTGLTTALSVAQGGTGNTTGLAATATALATSRSISTTGDATWTVNFNGTADATAALTLANSGVGAGTYGSVTVNAKGLVTAASTATPVANGGTGQTTIAAASLALSAAKLPWASYTPTVTAVSGTYTAASATGRCLIAFGICYVEIKVTITTKGTGVTPVVTLPSAALSGSAGMLLLARESAINGKVGAAVITAGLTQINLNDYANADLVTGDGAVISISGSYPVA